jgi:hypothetical protein
VAASVVGSISHALGGSTKSLCVAHVLASSSSCGGAFYFGRRCRGPGRRRIDARVAARPVGQYVFYA